MFYTQALKDQRHADAEAKKPGKGKKKGEEVIIFIIIIIIVLVVSVCMKCVDFICRLCGTSGMLMQRPRSPARARTKAKTKPSRRRQSH